MVLLAFRQPGQPSNFEYADQAWPAASVATKHWLGWVNLTPGCCAASGRVCLLAEERNCCLCCLQSTPYDSKTQTSA